MEEQLRANFQAVFDACASRLLPLSSRLVSALPHAAPPGLLGWLRWPPRQPDDRPKAARL